MRGRKPEPLQLKPKDALELQRLLQDGRTAQRVACRARILWGRAHQACVEQLANKVEQDPTTVWRVVERYRHEGLQRALYDAPRSGRPRVFSPQEKRRMERLACRRPAKVGWPLTPWSTRSLAQAAMEQQIVPDIHPTTIGTLLRAAKLQPHRVRFWKTTLWDEEAVECALRLLWLYERIDWLWQRGEVVLALDEKPNLQVLERAAATQPMRPGQIERQEFEYLRHGTLNVLAGLTLHTGHMWAEGLDRNDSAHFCPALRRFLPPYGWARRLHLIMDEGPSHTSAATQETLEQ